MAYVSGFVAPVKTGKREDYLKLAQQSWDLFKDYGALETRECWADGIPEGDVTSFPRSVQCAANETVVLSWIVWPDKAAADACFASFGSDKRWDDLDMTAGGADMKRMFFGGFDTLMHKTA